MLRTACTLLGFAAVVVFEKASNQSIDRSLDRVFLTRVHEDFYRGMLGDIYYDAGQGAGRSKVGQVQYYTSITDYTDNAGIGDYTMLPLSVVVDISTWKFMGYDSPLWSLYEDAGYEYKIRYMSDGVDIFCYPRQTGTDKKPKRAANRTGGEQVLR